MRWVIGILVTLFAGAVASSHTVLDRRIDAIDGRLNKIEDRIGKVDERIGKLEERMRGVETGIAEIRIELKYRPVAVKLGFVNPSLTPVRLAPQNSFTVTGITRDGQPYEIKVEVVPAFFNKESAGLFFEIVGRVGAVPVRERLSFSDFPYGTPMPIWPIIPGEKPILWFALLGPISRDEAVMAIGPMDRKPA